MTSPIKTTQFQLAQKVLTTEVRANGIAAVYGPPGTGKTYAVEHFLRNAPALKNRPWLRLQMSFKPSPKEIFVRLLTELGAPASGTAYEMAEEVLRHLSASSYVIVIDEAHHLKTDGLQQLRYLHDRGNSSWSLILVGSDINTALNSASELRSRVSCRAAFDRLVGADLLAAVVQLHPAMAALDRATIREIDERFARGNLRDWSQLTNHAVQFANDGPITSKHGPYPRILDTGCDYAAVGSVAARRAS